MKQVALAICMILSAIGFGQLADFSFKKNAFHFGKIQEGTIIKQYVIFKNSGKAPLIIEDYGIECTCTKVEYPRYPIPPGQTDSLLLIFDSKGKKGKQDREVILYVNTKQKEASFRFTMTVIPRKENK